MFKKEKIYSFELIALSLSGMRIMEEYEIIRCGNKAQLSRYTVMYSGGEDRRRLEQRAETDCDEIIALLNDCAVLKWDGFYGKNPPSVLDGTMFSFRAEINDGRKIRASGSNNFPKHYRDFTNALYDILRRDEEKNERG